MKINYQMMTGFLLIGFLVVLGFISPIGDDITAYPRLIVGFGIGFVLARGVFGFAGMANRTFRTGNSNLIRGMMYVVMMSSVVVGVILLTQERLGFDVIALSTFPISAGLFIGGIMFGIGMALSSCCATGVLQDMVSDPYRGITTLLFFGIGVLVGFPLKDSPLVSEALIGPDEGVSLLSVFSNNLTAGVLFSVIVTILIASLVIALANHYEKRVGFKANAVQDISTSEETLSLYEKLFVKPFSLFQTSSLLTLLIAFVWLLRGKGWSASSVAGYWMATILSKFGVSSDALADYAGKEVVIEVFKDPSSLQNIGIAVGTIVALLLSGQYINKFKASLKKQPLEIALFALGGLLMGVGTRFSLGCNVGAFLTPVVGYSISGWIYFVVLIGSGYLGNIIFKKFYQFIK
jgi:uncharacterized membrane protein YedE/YeeE